MLRLDIGRISGLRSLLDQTCYDIVARNVKTAAIKSLPEKTRLLVQLFCLGKKLHAENVKDTLGSKILGDLLKLNLLIADADKIMSNYVISPFNNCYFVWGGPSIENSAYIGADSLALAKYLPFNLNAAKVLDLCSGTGIQAILLAKNAKRITGVELSPEVANIARFNVFLNNAEDKVDILQGDLYEAVKNEKFDLVVSNPPFMPVPDTLPYPICWKGGEDGLLIQKKLFTNISDYMTKNGLGLTVGVSLGDRQGPFILELFSRIAKKKKLDIDILLLERWEKWQQISFRSLDILNYFHDLKADPRTEWIKIYDQAKAECAYFYIVRLKKGKGRITLIKLFDEKYGKKETGISEDTSLKSLYFQFVKSFIGHQYNKAISIYRNMEKFSKALGLKYEGNIFFISEVSYQKLRRYKEAIIELKKAEKINPEEAQINFSLSKCYRNISRIKLADKELKKGVLKLPGALVN